MNNSLIKSISVSIGMALFLSLIGALGTDSFGFLMRLAYWLLLMLGGTAIAYMVEQGLNRFKRYLAWRNAIIMLICITPLVTVLVWQITGVFNNYTPSIQQLWSLFAPVFIITFAVVTIRYFMDRTPQQSHIEQSLEPSKSKHEIALRARLDFKFQGADIYAVSAEDHYLRVHTSLGETLILMRLYDAIIELDGIEGSQTHRSWWVARNAVANNVRNDGRLFLALKNGLTVPVSRSYQKALRSEGWL